MGRLLRFLAELFVGIDPIFTWIVLCVCVGVFVWVIVKPAASSMWFFLARPFAVLFGHLPHTAYDFLVLGWKAERRGDWVAALKAYDHAVELEPKNTDTQERRATLLAAHPKLNESKSTSGNPPEGS
jgi:hypothetical protein